MSNAIAVTSQPLSDQWKYAQALAQAGLLPKQYRDSPGDILLALAYADALALPVAQIFTGIHVIEGRPSMSAELMGALVRRAGHRIRSTGDAASATAEIVRRDDPEFTYRSTFTIVDAKQAGLLSKDVWKRYPAAMLLARATSAVCRAGAADVLAGVSYVPEELGEAPEWVEEAPVTRLAVAPVEHPGDDEIAQAAATVEEQPTESPKRKRRTKAEMEAARAAEANVVDVELPEPASVAETHAEAWVHAWLIDLDQAVDAKDLAAIGLLGSKAATGNRRDLVAQAREAWQRIHEEATA